MQKQLALIASFFASFAFVAACSSGGDGGFMMTPPPPPPPPAAQSVAGIWSGTSVTDPAPDVFTSFEFNETGPFSVGSAPYTADFSNGNAESRGIPSFYITGLNAWHILIGTSATVTFETLPNTLDFFVRMEAAGNVGLIEIFDEYSVMIDSFAPTNAFQRRTITRTAGQSLIGSMTVTSTSGGDVVIDDLTFGYSGAGFAGSNEEIGCVVAETGEFACVLNDPVSGDLTGAAGGNAQVSGTNVSGGGTTYAVPGTTLPNGQTTASATISSGTVSSGSTLDLVVDAAGATSTIDTDFDESYNRGSDLATIAATYTDFDIFGEASSFTIDAAGAITGQSLSGCVLNGQVTIIDAGFNAYDVQLDVSSCGALNGSYDGLGVTQDDADPDDTFVFAAFNADGTLVGAAVR